jgi:hypothetical protein
VVMVLGYPSLADANGVDRRDNRYRIGR